MYVAGDVLVDHSKNGVLYDNLRCLGVFKKSILTHAREYPVATAAFHSTKLRHEDGVSVLVKTGRRLGGHARVDDAFLAPWRAGVEI